MSPTQQLVASLPKLFDRDEARAKALKEFGLKTTNHMFGTAHPLAVKVPGTRYGRLL